MLISRKPLNPPKNEGRTVLSLSDSLYTQSEAFEPLFYPGALNSATNNGFTMEKSPYISHPTGCRFIPISQPIYRQFLHVSIPSPSHPFKKKACSALVLPLRRLVPAWSAGRTLPPSGHPLSRQQGGGASSSVG